MSMQLLAVVIFYMGSSFSYMLEMRVCLYRLFSKEQKERWLLRRMRVLILPFKGVAGDIREGW